MDTRFQVALDTAFIYAHAFLRRAQAVLRPHVKRTVRAKMRRTVRHAEALLRRAILLLTLDMAPDLPPPTKTRSPAARKAGSKRSVPAFQLTEPPARVLRRQATFPAGVFERLGPDDQVPIGHLAARVERLQAALADPMRRARRLAVWLRCAGSRVRKPRPLKSRFRMVERNDPYIADWAVWIDAVTRDALCAGPG